MDNKAIMSAQARCQFDDVFRVMIERISNRVTTPSYTREDNVRHYAQAAGIPVSKRQVRNISLYLSMIGVAELKICSRPEIHWLVDAIEFAARVKGIRWVPSDAEINKFMESL